jgi:hypothetical protein
MIMIIASVVASLFVFSAFFMKTMIPLRIIAICSNIAFIAYALLGLVFGVFSKVAAILILHSLLLPVNIIRLVQMKGLIKKVKLASSKGEHSMDYLVPYMKPEIFKEGDLLFKKGDFADKIFFIQSGSVVLPEVQKEVGPGAILGEVGVFAPNNKRACSAVAACEASILTIKAEKVLELYYQNPKFGFFMIRSIAKLVSENDSSKGSVIITFDDYSEKV